MLQSHHPQQILPSPARLGLTNPNSPSVPNPSTPKLSSTSQQPQQQQQQTATPTVTKTSSTLLSLLPPLPRAQSLLLQMASLATKLFDISPNRSHWITSFRGSLPSFLPSQTQTQTLTHTADAVSSTKEILSSFTSLQTQLFEAVAQLQEILDLQDAKQKVAHDIRSMDNSILAFTKKLKEAVQVLELLVDDYSDYRQPKRLKSGTTAPSTLNLSDILSYAHRISYTTFAPPEFGAGEAPLRGALPPAPQDEQMRASQLYNFADLDVGLPKEVETKEKAVETLIETPITTENPLATMMQGMLVPPPIPSGWRPGMPVELPTDLPPVPPGWKPGDPVPLPPLEALVGPKKDEEQRPAPPKVPAAIPVRPVVLDINPDHDDYSSDYSSDVGSSEEDDED